MTKSSTAHTAQTDDERGLAAALDAARRGLPVLPSAAGDGKHPARRYAHLRELGHLLDPERIRRADWSAGVCVLAHGDLYVIDADSAAPAAALLDWAPDTLRVKTRQGRHAYFRLPAGVLLRQGGGITIEGLRFDCKGEASTGSPTVAQWWTPGGHKVVEHDAPTATMPAWLIAAIGPPTASEGGGQSAPKPEQLARWNAAYIGAFRLFGPGYHRDAARETLRTLGAADRSSTNALHGVAKMLGRGVPAGEIRYDDAYKLIRAAYTGAYPNIGRSTHRGLLAGAELAEAEMSAVMEGASHAR